MVSVVLCTKHLRWRSSISVSVTPNNSGYNAAGLAENEHTPYVIYAKRIAANFQRRMAMLRNSCTQT